MCNWWTPNRYERLRLCCANSDVFYCLAVQAFRCMLEMKKQHVLRKRMQPMSLYMGNVAPEKLSSNCFWKIPPSFARFSRHHAFWSRARGLFWILLEILRLYFSSSSLGKLYSKLIWHNSTSILVTTFIRIEYVIFIFVSVRTS